MTEKMNIHKALCELKTLDSRISTSIFDTQFAFANKHSNTKISGVAVSEVCDNIKSKYDSIRDLMRRRDAIKRAVVKSNASTEVVIGGVTYTVAEAIDMKNHGISYKKDLVRKMSRDYETSRTTAERANGVDLERRADENIKSIYGATEIKSGMTAEIQKARDAFIKAQTVEVVDPVGVSEEIERMTKEIDNFSVDVDSALSVSNAITEIEISY